MFRAHLISLNDGQSFQNADICEQQDFERLGIDRLFGDLTSCFYVDKKCILLHNWSIKLIQLNKNSIKGKNSVMTNRLVLDGNITFSPAYVIDPETIGDYGIPLFFDVTGDRGGQLTFSSSNGIFMTHATNVASMIIDSDRNIGITQKLSFKKPVIKQSIQPRINRK